MQMQPLFPSLMDSQNVMAAKEATFEQDIET